MALSQTIADSAGQVHGQLFAGLNPLDWVIVVLLAISAFTAFMRGLIRSLISIAGVVLGILLGAWYAPTLAGMLLRWIPQPTFAEIAAFLLILAGCYLLAMITGWLLRNACEAVGLGFADRLGGAAFGILRAVLLLAALILPLSPFLRMLPFARNSVLLPYLRSAAHGVSFVLPRDFADRLTSGTLTQFPAFAGQPDSPKHRTTRNKRDDTAQGDEP